MTTEKSLWLNIGCCDNLLDGFLNIDLPRHDLRNRWKFEDSTVDYILAQDIIEHLPDKVHTMNEAWRVLKPGGIIKIAVPTTDGPGAWQDPQHCSYWNRNSFKYYESGNIYRDRFAKSYGIKAAFRIKGDVMENSQDGPRLTIILEACK